MMIGSGSTSEATAICVDHDLRPVHIGDVLHQIAPDVHLRAGVAERRDLGLDLLVGPGDAVGLGFEAQVLELIVELRALRADWSVGQPSR